jgi:PAS domain S-box-containing protein
MKLRVPMMSLRASLALSLAVAIVVTFLIVGSGILIVRLPQVQERALEQARGSAQTTVALLERILEAVEQQLAPVATLARSVPAAGLQAYLDALVRQGGDFEAAMLLDESGVVRALSLASGRDQEAATILKGQDLSANALYLRVRAEQGRHGAAAQRAVWSDSYFSPVRGEVTVGVGVAAGRQVLIGEVSLPRLLRIVQTVSKEDIRLVVIDQRGRWLASNAAGPAEQRIDYNAFPGFQDLIEGRQPREAVTVLGQPWWVGGQVSERLSWLVAGGVPAGLDNYSYRVTVLLILVGFLATLIVSLSLAPFWATRLSRPFQRLAARARRVAEGDYQLVAAPSIPIREFRVLERDLDSMAQAIQARESAVRRSEQQLKAVLESTPSVAIQWYDREGRVLYWNPASTAMYGFSADEALGCSIRDNPLIYLDHAQAQGFIDVLGELDRTGGSVGPVEFELRHQDGHTVIVLATTFVIPGDDGHSIFVCMDIDISEQKRAQLALQDQEAKLEAIFNASPAPMSVSDASRGYPIVSVNVAWETLFGRRREEVLGHSGAEIGFWADAADRERFLSELQQTDRVQNFEAWCIGAQGRSILCQFSALVAQIGSERLLLMMTVDVTERRRIERDLQELNAELEQRVERRTEQLRNVNQQLETSLQDLRVAQAQLVESEKLAALGQLVAGVAHELNTPIGNGLLAVTTLDEKLKELRGQAERGLRRSELDAFLLHVQQTAEITVRNLERSAELVRSFKQLAVDQTSSQRRSFTLDALVQEVLITMGPTIRRTPYQVETAIAEGLELDSYPGPLGQVLGNLINNAVLHAFEDQPVGTITIEAEAIDGAHLRLVVRDDGRGIEPALRKKVFEPFFTTRMGRGGTGLGLQPQSFLTSTWRLAVPVVLALARLGQPVGVDLARSRA